MIEYLKKEGNSKYQEIIAEYAFLKDLLLDGVRNQCKILISRSDFDVFGYDVLAQLEGQHKVVKIQLKAFNGKTAIWDVQKSLIKDKDGTVIIINLKDDGSKIKFQYFILNEDKREKVINQNSKSNKQTKCSVKKRDFIEIKKGDLVKQIFKIS
jgi:hypothetical protein